MLTLLHAADLHLDSPFRSLPHAEAQTRRAGQRKALDDLADLALDRRADLVLLSGDLFDDQQVYPETLEALARALGRLSCPVVIAPGNHDYYSDASPYAKPIWPDNVHIFTTQAVAALPFPDLGVTVYGYAFTAPFLETDPLAGFRAADDGTLALGCFHGEVGKAGRYAPIDPASLEQSGLAYAALGHVHAATAIQGEKTPWAYAGCPQGRGFDELGEKGALVLRFEEGRLLPPPDTVHGALVPLPGPRYWALRLPVDHADPAEALRAALAGSYEDDYVRLTLTGEAEAVDLAALRTAGEALCRVFDLRNETVPPLDLWRRAGEDTLTGHFLREMKDRLDSARTDEDRALFQRALRCGLAALEGRETPQW